MTRAVREQRDQRLGLVRAALDRAAQAGKLVGELTVHPGDAGGAQLGHAVPRRQLLFGREGRGGGEQRREGAGRSFMRVRLRLSCRRASGQAT